MWRRPSSKDPNEFGSNLRHSINWAKRARWAVLAVMVVLVLLPFAGEAESWLGRNEFAGTSWPAIETGVWNTLILSVATLVGTLLLAVPAAYFLASKRTRWRGAYSCSCSSPWPSPGSYSSFLSSKRSCGSAW